MTSESLETLPPPAREAASQLRQSPVAGRAGKPELPLFQRSEVSRLNMLHRTWQPVEIRIGEACFLLRAGGGSAAYSPGPHALIILSAGTEVASVSVPAGLLDEIITKAGGSSIAQMSAQSVLLLLEHLLSSQLTQLEYDLNQKLSLTSIHYPARPLAGAKLFLECSSGAGSYRFGTAFWGAALERFAMAASGRDTKPGVWPGIPVEVALRLGMASVPGRLLESIRPGDVIIADVTCGRDRVIAVAGERFGAAGLIQNESVKLVTPLARLTGTDEETWSMSESTPQLTGNPHGHDSAVDDIVVKLMFEMGRKEISLGELRTITAGHIFEFSRPPGSSVDIFAGSRRIGQGEIVQIGEALGVRVTRLFNNE